MAQCRISQSTIENLESLESSNACDLWVCGELKVFFGFFKSMSDVQENVYCKNFGCYMQLCTVGQKVFFKVWNWLFAPGSFQKASLKKLLLVCWNSEWLDCLIIWTVLGCSQFRKYKNAIHSSDYHILSSAIKATVHSTIELSRVLKFWNLWRQYGFEFDCNYYNCVHHLRPWRPCRK